MRALDSNWQDLILTESAESYLFASEEPVLYLYAWKIHRSISHERDWGEQRPAKLFLFGAVLKRGAISFNVIYFSVRIDKAN